MLITRENRLHMRLTSQATVWQVSGTDVCRSTCAAQAVLRAHLLQVHATNASYQVTEVFYLFYAVVVQLQLH
jgi:hypothetical protein